MNADKARIRELEEILLFIAGGLRSKAKVYANQRNINPAAAGDPVQILSAAADEIQTAVGARLRNDYASAYNQFRVRDLELVVGDQVRQFGPMPNLADNAALVSIEITQYQQKLERKDVGVFAERPNGMGLRIIIDPARDAEQFTGEHHGHPVH